MVLSVEKYLADCSMNEKFNFLLSFNQKDFILNTRFDEWIIIDTNFTFLILRSSYSRLV